jgi:hypothetical protein
LARLCLFLTILWLAFPPPAQACVLYPGPDLSKAEQRQLSRAQTTARSKEAARRLASSNVNVAADLAELLVPNIRPILLQFSSCGQEGEIDLAGGLEHARPVNIADDPRLAGINLSDHGRTIRDFGGTDELAACNVEFRDRFAGWLSEQLSEEDMRASWLFLIARKREQRRTYGRLMTFDRETRKPPVHWWSYDRWIAKDIDRFVTKDAAGRRLAEKIASFWGQHAAMLESDDLACPNAKEAARKDREALINEILRERKERLAGA